MTKFENSYYNKIWSSKEGAQIVSTILKNSDLVKIKSSYYAERFKIDPNVCPSNSKGEATFISKMRELERVVMLKVVDEKWMNHIDAMDELKDGIGLRAYGQKDPVVQYRIEGSDMFEQMVEDIKTDVVKILLNVHKSGELRRKETVEITNASLENINGLDNDTVNSKEPVKTSYGYHIIYRIDQKEKPTLEDVKEEILDSLVSEKKSEDANIVYIALDKMRDEAGLKFSDTVLEKKYNTYMSQYK